jgi:hypothetical protein
LINLNKGSRKTAGLFYYYIDTYNWSNLLILYKELLVEDAII